MRTVDNFARLNPSLKNAISPHIGGRELLKAVITTRNGRNLSTFDSRISSKITPQDVGCLIFSENADRQLKAAFMIDDDVGTEHCIF